MKKKILYLMAIDWKWIKQRPQFIAIELEKDYELTVVYLSELFNGIELRKDNDEVKDCKSIPAIPFRDKSIIASWIQKILFVYTVGNIDNYESVWIGHPSLYKYIPRSYSGRIIYDCMDDHAALCSDKLIKRTLIKVENKLVKRADFILATSQVLLNKMENMGGKGKTYLVRNGFLSDTIYTPENTLKKGMYKLGYYGTIAEWIDFTLLEKSLTYALPIEYHFIGPVNHVKVPANSKIILEGVVEHAKLYEKTKEYDCYIMPFIVNDTIQAVDPVKLYEYISMGKCIISVWYKEIERFEPYVYFYKNEQEYIELIKLMCEKGFPPKYSEEQQRSFLESNSWKVRYREIKEIMRKS